MRTRLRIQIKKNGASYILFSMEKSMGMCLEVGFGHLIATMPSNTHLERESKVVFKQLNLTYCTFYGFLGHLE